ncbi:MAG: hypothetical protein HN700_07600 [Verrucomicrobia bacterium]|nr:hypothetical protein [Verrucomicrobiota bacterium]
MAKLDMPAPQEREWPNIDVKQETRPRLHPGNLGQFYETRFKGTLDHCTKYRAHITLPSGEMIAIPFFHMCVLDLSYIETQLTLNNMPKTVRDWTIEPTDKSRNLLIDIDAADLKLGRFKTMKNKGMLGGEIINANHPPLVEMVHGRKAITFQKEERVGHKNPAYEMLTSTFTLRERLDRNQPFTMSSWLYTEDQDGQTIMSWHSIGGDHGTRLSLGHCDIGGMSQTSRGSSGEEKHPIGLNSAPRWQHVAYVYTGGEDGELRIYNDGDLVSQTRYDNIVHRRPVREDEIGTTNATIRADLLAKTGEAWVGLYMGPVDHHNWHQLRWWRWPLFNCAEWQKPGEVKFEMKNLKPGTRYYYRILSDDNRKSSWGYSWNLSRRWSYGPGSFVTATEDGKKGYTIPEDTRKHFFIGCDWSAHWFYGNPGPSKWFKGSIASIKLSDYAMNEFEVRKSAGLNDACSPLPEDDAALDVPVTDLAWTRADADAVEYKVYLGTKKEDVEQGTVTPITTKATTHEKQELADGKRYFWRVAQIDKKGNAITEGRTWTFRVITAEARTPSPEPGASISPMGKLGWDQLPKTVKGVNLYIAESESELSAMTEPTTFLKGMIRSYTLPHLEMVMGRTYYWRADIVQADDYVTPGPVWHFTVDAYFTPESDTVSQEPLPDESGQEWGSKMMEEDSGHPAIAIADANESHMSAKIHGTAKMLGKSEAMAQVLEANYNGTTLGNRGRGAGMVQGCSYGATSTGNGDLLFHEMGHQVFNILGKAVPGYSELIEKAWLGHADDNVGLGGYNAQNWHENMAVYCHRHIYANGRDRSHRLNYLTYMAIKEHLPGELYIDLDAKRGVTTDDAGIVKSWANSGGFERWAFDAFEKTEGTVGEFVAHGDPKLGTINGVTCVILDGNDAFEWDLETKWALDGNRDFAVEFWALKHPSTGLGAGEAGAPGQVLTAWGTETDGARFLWGSDNAAYRHSQTLTGEWGAKPAPGKWQHIVQLYQGGPESESEGVKITPQPYRVYVNGKLAQENKHQFDLGGGATVYVGGLVTDGKVSNGFKGALAHVRIYDYDLSKYQIDNHYAEESPAYNRDTLAVAGKLYVDMDARYLADSPRMHHRPTYHAKLHKPWLRSWANHGSLGGRIHNDIHSKMWGYSGSRPQLRENMGTPMPTFAGMDRMVSGFEPDTELLANPPRTLELWLDNQAESDDEVILEWGEFQLTAAGLPKGRQCVTVVFGEANTVYVNGRKIAKTVGVLAPADGQRLHLGGHYDDYRWNWKRYFNGTIAALRIHKGALTGAQVKANAAAQLYSPGNSGVVTPKPNLNQAPVYDFNAAQLKTGAFTAWPNKGSAAGSFVPGSRGDMGGLPISKFKGITGVQMTASGALEASFDTPESLTTGPFTVYAYVARHVALRNNATLVRWSDKAKLSHFGGFSGLGGDTGLAYFWRRIVVTYDGNTMKHYVDGELEREKEMNFNVSKPDKLMIGDLKNSWNYVHLNEVKLFSRALTAKEVKSLEPGKKVAHKDCIVAVEVPEQDEGSVITTLQNKGSLGGSFNTMKDIDHTPEVAEIDGVRCVNFDGKADFLMSSQNTPDTLTGDHAFTIEAKVYANQKGDSTVLALAPWLGEGTGRVQRDLNLCAPGGTGIMAGQGRHKYPWNVDGAETQWTHLACAYDGGRRSRIRLFVDGKLVNTFNRRSFATIPGFKTYMGASFVDRNGEKDLFNGAVASLKAYDYARTEEQIKAAAK